MMEKGKQEVPQHLVLVKTMVRHAVSLQPMEVNGGPQQEPLAARQGRNKKMSITLQC